MERRKFLKSGGLVSIASLVIPSLIIESCKKKSMDMNHVLGSSISIKEGSFNTLLPVPSFVKPNEISMFSAQNTSSQLIKGQTSSVYGYHNSILGPMIKANNGDSISINFMNQLTEETNIHWHGLVIPQAMDGHPDHIIPSGSSFNYQFNINQRAGMYWYHPHPEMKTSKQVFMGLAGFFIVNDVEEENLNLPKNEFEIPLVIQDKRINSDYSLNYTPTETDKMNGYLGQYILINGLHSTYKEVESTYYRVRILNGSTARIYNLALSTNAQFTVIGSDGGLLSTPEKVSSLLLAPGERIDILIDFSGLSIGSEVYLQSNTFDGASIQGTEQFKLLKFLVTKKSNQSFTIPTLLSTITPINTSPSLKVRTWVLGGGMSGMGSMPGMTMNMPHTINDKTYVSSEILASVKAGDTEIWEIDNSMNTEIHPFHIHGVQFQVLSRTGGRGQLIASEKGWKDTVLLMAYEKVRVIITFPQNKGKYVIHCHNLEHEDSGMMVNYEIV
jgi:blue copper oxidase